MPEGRWPRGVTPRPRSGAAASGREYQTATAQERLRGATLRRRSGLAAERRYPASEVRGGGREKLPHSPKPEAKGGGREEQPHDQGQGRWPGGPTPRSRSRGCVGAGGPRGAAWIIYYN